MCGGSPPPIPPYPPLPPPPAPLPVPTVDTARDKRRSDDSMLGRKGRASEILTSPQGDLSAPTTGTKKLLGS